MAPSTSPTTSTPRSPAAVTTSPVPAAGYHPTDFTCEDDFGYGTAPFASIIGGSENTAGSSNSSVTVGKKNLAKGLDSTVTGGEKNKAEGENTSISGGYADLAEGIVFWIGGGHLNKTHGKFSAILGGLKTKPPGSTRTTRRTMRWRPLCSIWRCVEASVQCGRRQAVEPWRSRDR